MGQYTVLFGSFIQHNFESHAIASINSSFPFIAKLLCNPHCRDCIRTYCNSLIIHFLMGISIV